MIQESVLNEIIPLIYISAIGGQCPVLSPPESSWSILGGSCSVIAWWPHILCLLILFISKQVGNIIFVDKLLVQIICRHCLDDFLIVIVGDYLCVCMCTCIIGETLRTFTSLVFKLQHASVLPRNFLKTQTDGPTFRV